MLPRLSLGFEKDTGNQKSRQHEEQVNAQPRGAGKFMQLPVPPKTLIDSGGKDEVMEKHE